MTALIILLMGLFLIFIEFYLPGGVLAVAGILFLIVANVLWIYEGATTAEGIFFLVVTIAGVVGSIILAITLIKKTKKSGSIYLDSDQKGFKASTYTFDLIDKKGECATDMRPGGFVLIDGKRYNAVSLSGYLSKGEKIVVQDIEGETLNIKKG